MSNSKARRNPTVVENSKYARGRSQQDDRWRHLDSLTQDREAIEQAKQEFAQISKQQSGRANITTELEDVEVQRRKPFVAAVAPQQSDIAPPDGTEVEAPVPLETRQAPAHTKAAAKDREVSPPDQPGASAPPRKKAEQDGRRREDQPNGGYFKLVEHKPVLAMPSRAADAPAHRVAPTYVEPWPIEAPPRSSRGLLVCGLIIAISVLVIWRLWVPERTTIGPAGLFGGMNQAVNGSNATISAPPGEHTIFLQGAPSISSDFANRVLEAYGSPAAGTGELWIELGKSYGIEPAYALAFFVQESSAGTNPGWAGRKPDGTTTHNVGNIICAGYATCFQGHRDYPSWEAGIDGWYRLIAREYVEGRGLGTVEQILPIYCPTSDGCAPDNYVKVVNKMIDQWRQGKLTP